MVIPKPKRLVDKKAIEAARKPYCEVCFHTHDHQVHHVKSRGSGGDDTPSNLICLCVVCHTKAHNGQITKDQLREIVRRREDAAPPA